MNGKINAIALAGVLSLFSYTGEASAQNQGRAELKNAEGKSVGTAHLRETKNGVLIALNVKGLPPGLHAVHVHAVGKCEGPDFKSAGDHFNPTNKKHGFKNPEGPHAGDLPDMYVNKDGAGRYEVLVNSMTLGSGETSVFDTDGSAVVIHTSGDDSATDPAGNSGDRIACGVITKSGTKK